MLIAIKRKGTKMNETTKTVATKENVWLTSIKRSKNTIALNLKFIFSNKKLLTIISVFYLIAMVLPTIFLPFYLSGGVIILVAVILPGLIILGAVGANLHSSTLYKNISTSGIRKRTFYISQLITTIIVVNILSAVLWTIIFILGRFNIFLDGWVWEHSNRMKVNPFAHWTMIPIIYVTNQCALLIFAVYFLIDSFTNDSKTYNIIIAGIFIIGIIFGGSMNTYFSKPHNIWLYDISKFKEFGISGIDYYETSYNGIIYVTEDYYNLTNQLQDTLVNFNPDGIGINGQLFPESMFVPTLIFNPFYAVGEFTSTAITKGMSQEYVFHLSQQIVIVDDLTNLNEIGTMSASLSDSVSVWSWFDFSFKGRGWTWSLMLLQPYITIVAYLGIGAGVRRIKSR